MSNYGYYCSINFKDKELKQKIMDCCKPYTNPLYSGTYLLDIYYLLGIRDHKTLDGDETMNNAEKRCYKEVFGDSPFMIGFGPLIEFEVNEADDYLYLSSWDWLFSIAIAISRRFPNVAIEAYIARDEEVDEEALWWENLYVHYCFLEGKVAETNGFKEGIRRAKHGHYDDAIEALWPSAICGDIIAMHNLGVCFEKLKEYEQAAYCYSHSNGIEKQGVLIETNKNVNKKGGNNYEKQQ